MCFYQIAEKSGRFDLFQKIAETVGWHPPVWRLGIMSEPLLLSAFAQVCFRKGRRQSLSR